MGFKQKLKEGLIVGATGIALAAPATADVTGDITVKVRVVDETPDAIEEDPDRIRLNLKLDLGKKIDFQLRHDGTDVGYGGVFLRYNLGNGLGVGPSVINDITYDFDVGEWVSDRNFGLHGFYSPMKGLAFIGHVSDDIADTQLIAQYTKEFGEDGPALRAFMKNNPSRPRLQKLEIEGSSPPVKPLGGVRFMAQYNRAGTPNGYVQSVEFGVKKAFKYRRK